MPLKATRKGANCGIKGPKAVTNKTHWVMSLVPIIIVMY